MQRVGEADTHDYDALFRDARPALWRTLYGFTGGRADIADDAVAEAFARALRRTDSIREPVPWIYRTAFRIAAAELRRDSRTSIEVEAGQQHDPAELEELMQALRELSPNQRAAVILHYQADLPTDEVARRMGTAPATVRVHLHRGRRRLRQLLGAEEAEGD